MSSVVSFLLVVTAWAVTVESDMYKRGLWHRMRKSIIRFVVDIIFIVDRHTFLVRIRLAGHQGMATVRLANIGKMQNDKSRCKERDGRA